MKKAEEDHAAAAKLARGNPPLHSVVCFHCQQSAEKYLKGMMEELGLSIPRTHILEDLLSALLPHHPTLLSLKRGLIILTSYAVEIRYPGDSASRRQAKSALVWEGRVRTAARALLGIRPPRKRKKST